MTIGPSAMLFSSTQQRRSAQSASSLIVAGLLLALLSGCVQTQRLELEKVFYPRLPETPRIQFLTAINSEEDIGVERDNFKEFVTGKVQPVKIIARPWDIDHSGSRLYIVDKTFRRILVVDLKAKEFDFFSTDLSGPLVNPGGIFTSKAGYKYLADRGRGEILEFDRSDRFTRVFKDGDQFSPVDVVVDGDRVYACDVQRSEIKVFDRVSGIVVQTITGSGEPGGSLHTPSHLAIDDRGYIYVTDFLNFRVQVFDNEGIFVRVIGEPGDYPGSMPRPKGIAVDRDNHLYAIDSAFELVQIFDIDTGEVLLPFGKFGSLSGGTWLPAGIHIDYDNLEHFSKFADPRFHLKYLIYVANQTGPFKINVYGFGDWSGGNNN